MAPVIRTFSGRMVNLVSPTWRDIEIRDIAHALSQINRFTGHTHRPYTVAEHSILASFTNHSELALEKLLHDAHEAYIGDISSPLKRCLSGHRELAKDLDGAIGKRFGLALWPMHGEVKRVDELLLEAEMQTVMGRGAEISGETEHRQESPELVRARGMIRNPQGHGQKYWEEAFLSRFRELLAERELARVEAALQAKPAESEVSNA